MVPGHAQISLIRRIQYYCAPDATAGDDSSLLIWYSEYSIRTWVWPNIRTSDPESFDNGSQKGPNFPYRW